ncbi:flagellar hook-associated protein FlgL [Heliorestis acidaminivorans]|uniref:Flagellar hook-associated protein FlgL n=1 Tax=Heliorestis acidaminivorans TaxID=553427 RepID=A0A6I0F4N3_9FIRM|nr:flagellar hook-associated protein FlgL [Heliorestis acidaminivorans]KAB2953637.1 flagellar hook-associated protein FlgL [Heliorestis acidaminivorans]
MVTRVTQQMLNNTFMRNLESSYRQMEKFQNQLSTGKAIHRPGDNPVLVARSMYYRSNQVEVQKYAENAYEAKLWLEQTEGAVSDSVQVLHRVRELMVQASNDTLDGDAKEAIAKEIQELRDHLLQLSNTSIAGRYIFGGTNTLVQPAEKDGAWNGNLGEIKLELGDRNYVTVNTVGAKLFDYPDKNNNVFKLLDNITATLRDPKNESTEISPFITKVTEQINNMVDEQANLGARENRLDFTINRLESLNISLQSARSDAEDVNIARVITDLQSQENVYRAALSAGARIIQPSLNDFLR